MSADPRSDLIAAAQYFYKQGWMVGTAGNLSARLVDRSFWITASGKAKGDLTLQDFVRIQPDGAIAAALSDLKPSAETAIHQTLYQLFPEARACYHVHSVEANLVSRLVTADTLQLPPLEMLKGLGVWQDPNCILPIFENHLNETQIAEEIAQRFTVSSPQIPVLLIRDHGVTVWADSTTAARHFIELIEYIFRYLITARQAGISI